MKNLKKVLILGIVLLIIAGIIVVALKGFKVSLMFGKHDSIELKIGKDVDWNKVDEICLEVFGDKKTVVKEVELFNDSFQINVESITDEEKDNLITKVNEKFEIEKTVDDLKITSVSNKRIRDVVKPYILPVAIVYVLTYCYMLIRFRKLNAKKIVAKNFVKTVLIDAALLSLVAIARIPLSEIIVLVLILISILELVVDISKSENELNNIE